MYLTCTWLYVYRRLWANAGEESWLYGPILQLCRFTVCQNLVYALNELGLEHQNILLISCRSTFQDVQLYPCQWFQNSRFWPVMFSRLCLIIVLGTSACPLMNSAAPRNPLINIWLSLKACTCGNCVILFWENRPLCLAWPSSLHTGLSAWHTGLSARRPLWLAWPWSAHSLLHTSYSVYPNKTLTPAHGPYALVAANLLHVHHCFITMILNSFGGSGGGRWKGAIGTVPGVRMSWNVPQTLRSTFQIMVCANWNEFYC